MKYIVLSDIHGNKKGVEQLLSSVEYDGVIFAGDGLSDIEQVVDGFKVRGNCDFFSNVSNIVETEICGKKVMLTHGHMFGVKSGLGALINEAETRGVDLVIFGHTHIPYNEKINGITYLNPGTFKKSIFGKSTYAVVEFDDNGFLINLLEF